MSHKLLTTFLIVFVGLSILAAIYQGGGGIVSTTLTSNITEDAIYIPAESTVLFADKDIIVIDSEKIVYSAKNTTSFTAYTRGYGDTTPADHTAGARIYTTEASVLNDALGFNIAVEVEAGGTWGVITLPIKFFTNTLPHLILLNANFLKSPELQYIGIFWFAAGIALLVTLAIVIAPIAVSLITGIFGLVRR